ncbi:hypothetical protein Tco_0783446 [Tanacetum coccineum]
MLLNGTCYQVTVELISIGTKHLYPRCIVQDVDRSDRGYSRLVMDETIERLTLMEIPLKLIALTLCERKTKHHVEHRELAVPLEVEYYKTPMKLDTSVNTLTNVKGYSNRCSGEDRHQDRE